MHPETTQQINIHQENQTYVYNNHNINNIPALNPIDLYSRPQNYIYQRENPQNLVIHRQVENGTYTEKFRQDGGQNGTKNGSKEEPKENLKPNDQNKILYADYQNQIYQQQNLDKDDNNTSDNKLNGDGMTLIKGEYVCYKCNDVFPTKRGLKQHAKVCSENGENNDTTDKLGKFICSQCSYRCQSPAILKIHERTHTGEKPFSCTFCDYKSGQKNNVAKHILVHMKEKPFRCKYCDYRCAQKNNLVVHERTHTGYKPFACPHCDYRTVQKPNLVKHMYLHTDQKPFSCDICSYKCVQKTNLTKHKQRHMNERDGDKVEIKSQIKPYKPRQKSVKCPHCSYRCVQKSSLVKHMQFKHTEVTFESVSVDQCMTPSDNINDTIHNLSVSDTIQNLSVCDTIQNLSVKKNQVTECSDKESQIQS